MIIYDFDKCPVSDRNGVYGGRAGSKEGILIDGEYWLVKYPQKTASMKNVTISYTTSALSEYIGSHIYDILGYDVHETRLGIRNDKLVVACRDFCKEEGSLREIRTIKNIYNKEIEEKLDDSVSSTGNEHSVNLYELLLHLDHNPVLSKIPGIKERFWDCSVIDILINNNDRNNGNWGILRNGDNYELAPIFDNGASFFNKIDVEKMSRLIVSPDFARMISDSANTVYAINGRTLSGKKFLELDNDDLKNAIRRVVPNIKQHLADIDDMINDIPEEYNGGTIMPLIQKEYYKAALKANFEFLLEPKYSELNSSHSLKKEHNAF